MIITAGETEIQLLAGRAALLVASKALVVSDLHLGKSATFRARGLAVPEGSSTADLARLAKLITDSGATRLVIAGDLIHAADGWNHSVAGEFRDWLSNCPIPAILTEGNHDRRARSGAKSLPLDVVADLEIDGVLITHNPVDLSSGRPGIAGHLHPGVRIREKGRSSIRMTGFLLKETGHLILPAFSEFTGTQIISSAKGDRFFVEIRESFAELPAGIW